VSRKRKSEDEENMRDAKGEALNYVSKKAKIEDEKVEVEGRNGGPTASIVIFKLRIKLWLKLRLRLPTVAYDAVRNIIVTLAWRKSSSLY
jgi:septum formation topological specificity factor MinE